jgi:hypothetical protein
MEDYVFILTNKENPCTKIKQAIARPHTILQPNATTRNPLVRFNFQSKLYSQTTSAVTVTKPQYYASVLEHAMVVCFLEDQEIN